MDEKEVCLKTSSHSAPWFILLLGVVIVTFQGCKRPSKISSGSQPMLPVPTLVAVNAPVIFNSSISGKPRDVIYLQGARFGSSPKVFLSPPLKPAVQIPIINKGNNYIAAQIPGSKPFGLYAFRVFNGKNYSNTIYLNQAHGMSFDTPEVAPNGAFRLFGRNLLLPGATPTVPVREPSNRSFCERKSRNCRQRRLYPQRHSTVWSNSRHSLQRVCKQWLRCRGGNQGRRNASGTSRWCGPLAAWRSMGSRL